MRNTLAALVAVGLLLLVGCGSNAPGPGPVTEARHIVGLYRVGHIFVEYDEDGTVRYAESRLTMREEKLTDVGEFWFEDGQYFQKLTGFYKMGDCQGITGIYEVQLLENGNLRFSVVEDECTQRADLLAIEHEPTMRTGRT